MKLRAYYSAAYASADTPLLARLATAAHKVESLGLAEIHAPGSIDPKLLQGLHSDRYLHAFMQGVEPLASSQGIPWTPGIRDATLAMLGGQIEAARHAMSCGIAMNLARGFHHAVRDCGSGFCPINGLALVAHCLPGKRIFVLDCDEHGGNGTEEFAAVLPNLFSVSIFGTRFGCRGGTRSWAFLVQTKSQGFDTYLSALQAAKDLVHEYRPDLILYQAGADSHHRDPKSRTGMTARNLFERDLFVFRMARNSGIPILFLVAGGYQNAMRIARFNVNTVRAARDVYWA